MQVRRFVVSLGVCVAAGCENTPVSLGVDDPPAAVFEPPVVDDGLWRPPLHPGPLPWTRPGLEENVTVERSQSKLCRWTMAPAQQLTDHPVEPDVQSVARVGDRLVVLWTGVGRNGDRVLWLQRLSLDGVGAEPPVLVRGMPEDPAESVQISLRARGDHQGFTVGLLGEGCWFQRLRGDGLPDGAPAFLGERVCAGLRADAEGFSYVSAPLQGSPGEAWVARLRPDGTPLEGRAWLGVSPALTPVYGHTMRPWNVTPERFVAGWTVPLPAGGIAAALFDEHGAVLEGPMRWPHDEAPASAVQVLAQDTGTVAMWLALSPVTGLRTLYALPMDTRLRARGEAFRWTEAPSEEVSFAWAYAAGESLLAWSAREVGADYGTLRVAPVDALGRPASAPLELSRCAAARAVAVEALPDGAVVIYTDPCKAPPQPQLFSVALRCQRSS